MENIVFACFCLLWISCVVVPVRFHEDVTTSIPRSSITALTGTTNQLTLTNCGGPVTLSDPKTIEANLKLLAGGDPGFEKGIKKE